MSRQIDLELGMPGEGTAKRTAREWLERFLYERPGWHRSPDICAACDGRLSDRALRAAASSSNVIISGGRGFRHLERATPSEINHFLNDLRSRARSLAARYVSVRRRAHAVVG